MLIELVSQLWLGTWMAWRLCISISLDWLSLLTDSTSLDRRDSKDFNISFSVNRFWFRISAELSLSWIIFISCNSKRFYLDQTDTKNTGKIYINVMNHPPINGRFNAKNCIAKSNLLDTTSQDQQEKTSQDPQDRTSQDQQERSSQDKISRILQDTKEQSQAGLP